MTEDEARGKRCCGPDGCGDEGNERDGRRWCNGSACMAWRWEITPTEQQEHRYEVGTESETLKSPEGDGWQIFNIMRWANCTTVRWQRTIPHEHGFCGLAGRETP